MPEGVAFHVLFLGRRAFPLLTGLPLERADPIVVDPPALPNAHHVPGLVRVHAAAVADAPFSDEPFRAFARPILDLATVRRRGRFFSIAG